MPPLSKKQFILDAAEIMMSAQGKQTKISDIALRAGVNNSMIYHYFNNKEDLLFSVAGSRLTDIRNKMKEQISGLRDPVEKLRKFIWFRIHYLDSHRNYGNLILFECRSDLSFYSHPAFKQAVWFMKTLGEIIKEGINSGIFRNELNLWLVRDALFGMMDISNIDYIINDKVFTEEDFESLMAMILPMLLTQEKSVVKATDKRAIILNAAEQIFSEKGFEHSKIQDIAEKAGVGDGTIYDYFSSKQDLLFSVLREGFNPSTLLTGFQEHHAKPVSPSPEPLPVIRIEQFIRNFFLISITQPTFARLFVLNGIFNRSFYQSPASTDFTRYLNTIDPVFQEGQQLNHIRPDISPDMFIRLISGAFCHITLRWLVAENNTRINKISEINEMIRMMTRSITINT